jgi:hypothetical protein
LSLVNRRTPNPFQVLEVFRNSGSGTVALIIDHPDLPWVDQERLVKTNVAPAIGGLKAVMSEGSTRGMLDT